MAQIWEIFILTHPIYVIHRSKSKW
jgi:hypothetical protein